MFKLKTQCFTPINFIKTPFPNSLCSGSKKRFGTSLQIPDLVETSRNPSFPVDFALGQSSVIIDLGFISMENRFYHDEHAIKIPWNPIENSTKSHENSMKFHDIWWKNHDAPELYHDFDHFPQWFAHDSTPIAGFIGLLQELGTLGRSLQDIPNLGRGSNPWIAWAYG